MAEEDDNESPIKKKSAGGIGLILQGVNTALTAGVLAAVLLKGGGSEGGETHAASDTPAHAEGGHGGDEAKPAAPPTGEPGPLLALDDFVVRLRNPEKERFLRMTVQLELTSKEETAKAEALKPRARDVVLAYLSDRSFEELRGSRGIEDCKAAIVERLAPLYGKAMRGLYITNFIMQ